MTGFEKIHFSASDSNLPGGQPSPQGAAGGGATPNPGAGDATPNPDVQGPLPLPSHEKAGRLYLQTFLENAGNEGMVAVTTPTSPALVPEMGLSGNADAPALLSRALSFEQFWKGIPVFGGRVSIDVRDSDRQLVSINGQLAEPPEGVPNATLSPSSARDRLNHWASAGTIPEDAVPHLTWFFARETSAWHLTWHFTEAPIEPPEATEHDHCGGAGHGRYCLGPSPRTRYMRIDAFVDATSGEIVYFFPSTAALQIPIPMTGQDTTGNLRNFFGVQSPLGFELSDPMRNVVTYDFGGQDIDASANPALPATPVVGAARDIAAHNPAAVSAHYHGTKVFDFFNNELKRDGVDDKGMQLVSVVNVWSSRGGLPQPHWPNAVWWNKRMWYGAVGNSSFARHLDIIAHELTHGVIESSSGLIYRDLPGALNESYADIFGVIVANWYPNAPEPVANWTWQIGGGLGQGGGPLRDMSDPAATGQPAHFSQYVPLHYSNDYGGVHHYSGIHNKAIHHLLTELDGQGEPTFPVREAVLVLYLTLLRLTRTSDFADSRRTMESVTRAYFGNQSVRQARLDAIARAFGSVGL